MKSQIFIITRFSIRSSGGFKYNPGKDIFSNGRLKARFAAFEKIYLPSLQAQTDKRGLIVCLITDIALPDKWRDRLNDLVREMPFVKVLITPDPVTKTRISLRQGKFIPSWLELDTDTVVTTRLDDDDGLHPEFVATTKTKHASPQNHGKILTYTKGYFVSLKKQSLSKTSEKPFRTAGLSLISPPHFKATIHSGNHTKWGKSGRSCILDDKKGMFIMSNNGYNASGGRKVKNKLSAYPKALAIYPFLKDLLGDSVVPPANVLPDSERKNQRRPGGKMLKRLRIKRIKHKKRIKKVAKVLRLPTKYSPHPGTIWNYT